MAGPDFEWIDYEVSPADPALADMRSAIAPEGIVAELEMAAEGPAGTLGLRVPNLTPWPSPSDKARILLESAAEVEHALMVQYLYAAYSLKSPSEVSDPDQQGALDDASDQSWPQALLAIAREEMGHLMTVQNLLLLLGFAPNFEREDFPPRKDLYAFTLHLEPLTQSSLAKYVVAEAPANAAGIDDIVEIATVSAGPIINRVGVLYGLLGLVFSRQDQVEPGATGHAGWDSIVRFISTYAYRQAGPESWHLPDDVFHPESADNQAGSDDWNVAQLRVHRVADRAAALDAVRDIGEQGEGPSSGGQASHFERFLRIFRGGDLPGFPEPGDWRPTRPVPTDPKLSDITDSRTRRWAELSDARYALLLGFLGHYLCSSGEVRRILTGWIFTEMRSRLAFIARNLTSMPIGADPASDACAAIPFTLPSQLKLPDDEAARWRLHLERTTTAIAIAQQLSADDTLASHKQFLIELLESDQARLAVMAQRSEPTITTSFARDIRPLFRPKDIAHMRAFLNLSVLEDVKENAGAILERLQSTTAGRMPPPPDQRWTATLTQLFQQWINDGFPP